MNYVLWFAGTMDEQEMWEKLPQEQLAEAYKRVNKWFEDHGRAGRIVGGEELRGPSTATMVHIKNGKATLTDGPGVKAQAREARQRALELCQNPAERRLLERKLRS